MSEETVAISPDGRGLDATRAESSAKKGQERSRKALFCKMCMSDGFGVYNNCTNYGSQVKSVLGG